MYSHTNLSPPVFFKEIAIAANNIDADNNREYHLEEQHFYQTPSTNDLKSETNKLSHFRKRDNFRNFGDNKWSSEISTF